MKEYKVIQGIRSMSYTKDWLEEFNETINRYIESGWEALGAAFGSGDVIYQTLIRNYDR